MLWPSGSRSHTSASLSHRSGGRRTGSGFGSVSPSRRGLSLRAAAEAVVGPCSESRDSALRFVLAPIVGRFHACKPVYRPTDGTSLLRTAVKVASDQGT